MYICNAYSFTHINLIPTFRIASKPILAQRISLCALSGNYMENQKEIWKTIDGYENYQVSNFGNVKSLNYRNTKKPKILKNIKMKIGYNSVTINKKIFYVHRLVAIHFIENPFNKREVNHLNGIKNDNFIENLEWCTPSENMKHAFNTKLNIPKRGEETFYSKLTNKEVIEIRNNNSISMRKLAKQYNISHQVISEIKNYKSWKHI